VTARASRLQVLLVIAYVAKNDDDPSGWVNRAKSRLPAMTDEAPEDDPPR